MRAHLSASTEMCVRCCLLDRLLRQHTSASLYIDTPIYVLTSPLTPDGRKSLSYLLFTHHSALALPTDWKIVLLHPFSALSPHTPRPPSPHIILIVFSMKLTLV